MFIQLHVYISVHVSGYIGSAIQVGGKYEVVCVVLSEARGIPCSFESRCDYQAWPPATTAEEEAPITAVFVTGPATTADVAGPATTADAPGPVTTVPAAVASTEGAATTAGAATMPAGATTPPPEN